jgi:hypothetical protein
MNKVRYVLVYERQNVGFHFFQNFKIIPKLAKFKNNTPMVYPVEEILFRFRLLGRQKYCFRLTMR